MAENEKSGTAADVESEVRGHIEAEAAAIRAVLEKAAKDVAAHLATIHKLASRAQSAWTATPPESRDLTAPFLTNEWACAARRAAAGARPVRAALDAIDTSDRVAAAREHEQRQRESDAEQEQRRRERQPEMDRIMGVETYAIGRFSPRPQPYNGD